MCALAVKSAQMQGRITTTQIQDCGRGVWVAEIRLQKLQGKPTSHTKWHLAGVSDYNCQLLFGRIQAQLTGWRKYPNHMRGRDLSS
jgi:hypothetical protein